MKTWTEPLLTYVTECRISVNLRCVPGHFAVERTIKSKRRFFVLDWAIDRETRLLIIGKATRKHLSTLCRDGSAWGVDLPGKSAWWRTRHLYQYLPICINSHLNFCCFAAFLQHHLLLLSQYNWIGWIYYVDVINKVFNWKRFSKSWKKTSCPKYSSLEENLIEWNVWST